MAIGKGIGGHATPNRGATNDWITPPEIIAALGPFDLDPCVCNPQPFVTAARMIARPDDGLAAKWEGRVWLNPPYGDEVWPWLDRLADHGNGIALIFARTETAGFHRSVWKRADGLLFLEGRLHFYHPDGTRARFNAGGPSVLVAYGTANVVRLKTCGLPGYTVDLEMAA